ncbi:MAG: hypothetical protein PHS46_08680, partial [Candidatus Omnitrophica bacterium]|nr:hypothetical protein [Candidatus Omnitrophota bacterium]
MTVADNRVADNRVGATVADNRVGATSLSNRSYAVDQQILTIPVELKPDGLYILGTDTININGLDQTGLSVIVMENAMENRDCPPGGDMTKVGTVPFSRSDLLLFNGSKIAIDGSVISIASGSAFFYDATVADNRVADNRVGATSLSNRSYAVDQQTLGATSLSNRSYAVDQQTLISPEAGTALGTGPSLSESLADSNLTPIQSLFAPALAWADSATGAKAFTFTDNVYTIASDGSKIAIDGSSISIVSGSAFFYDATLTDNRVGATSLSNRSYAVDQQTLGATSLSNRSYAVDQQTLISPEAGTALGTAPSLSESLADSNLTPIQSLFAPALAWADSATGAKAFTFTENVYTIASDGSIVAITGVFDIANDKIVVSSYDKFIGDESLLPNAKRPAQMESIGGYLDNLVNEKIDPVIWPAIQKFAQDNPGYSPITMLQFISTTLKDYGVRDSVMCASVYMIACYLVTDIPGASEAMLRLALSFAEGTVKEYVQFALESGVASVGIALQNLTTQFIGFKVDIGSSISIIKDAWNAVSEKFTSLVASMTSGDALRAAKEIGYTAGEACGVYLFIQTMGAVLPEFLAFKNEIKDFIGGIKNATIGKVMEVGKKIAVRRGIGSGTEYTSALGEVSAWSYGETGTISGTLRSNNYSLRSYIAGLGQSLEGGYTETVGYDTLRDEGFAKSISSERQGVSSERQGVSLFGEGLQILAEGISKLASEFKGACKSAYADFTINRFGEEAQSIIAGATGLGEAWGSAWSQSGLRSGWLAYGVGAIALSNIGIYTGEGFAVTTSAVAKDTAS